MTEKRFKCVSNYDWWGVIDITGEIKGEYDNDCFSTDTVVDLLNEQHEQLQTQKHIIDKQEMRIKELLDELYCKDRKLEELGVDIECCDKK